MITDTNCMKCASIDRSNTVEHRRHVVPGVGSLDARYMIVGEGPGRLEDLRGQPFVGDSGRLLVQLLDTAGIERKDCYITNVVKCRTLMTGTRKKRNPYAAEIAACRQYLDEEIRQSKAAVILLLGQIAVDAVLGKGFPLTTWHGQPVHCEGRYFVPMYHPAATMYSPNLLRSLDDDFANLRKRIALPPVPDVEYTWTDRPGTGGSVDAVAFDFETDGSNPGTCNVVGVSVCEKAGSAVYYPWGPAVGRWLIGRLRRANVLVAHNAAFELTILRRLYGEVDDLVVDDTKVLARLLNKPETRLKDLAMRELGVRMTTFEEATKGKTMAELSPSDIYTYACADADMTLRLYDRLVDEMSQKLMELYESVERPILHRIAEMQAAGVRLDVQRIHEICNTLPMITDRRHLSNKELTGIAGERGWPVLKRSAKTGAPSWDKAVLYEIAKTDEYAKVVLNDRKIIKLDSTYLSGLIEYRHSDGRVHGRFSTTTTQTFRFSSSEPNLQNIVKYADPFVDGRVSRAASEVLSAFVPADGCVFVYGDFSQLEWRGAADLSQDPEMMKLLRDGGHPHKITAATLFGSDYDAREYSWSKNFNFAVMYGAGPHKLMEMIPGLSYDDAVAMIMSFFERFPTFRRWIADTKSNLFENGYVETPTGYRRWLLGIWSKDFAKRAEAEREGVNMPIQCHAAWVVKRAMIDMAGQGGTLVQQVHDSMVYEVPVYRAKTFRHVLATVGGRRRVSVPTPIECDIRKTLKGGTN